MSKTITIPIAWKSTLIQLILLIGLFSWVFINSWQSLVSIWLRSDTFTHGFIVAPASVWLAWTRKELLQTLKPKSSPLAIVAILLGGFVWLAANLSQVLVVEQLALVGMLIALIWSQIGDRIALNLLFPLFFLFWMVPFGEDLVPYLIKFTADFTVWMVRLTGISVYQEGTFLTLTTGSWSVIEACSGIRYLIASITLGLLYAYLNYQSSFKRSIFILASVVVPIFANGLRAYMIVMIGHLSDMKLATGVDHIIYGWVFFGLVMLVLFYVGSFWQDPPLKLAPEPVISGPQNEGMVMSHFLVVLLTLVCLGVWPLLAKELKARQSVQATIPANLTALSTVEPIAPPDWNWQPQFQGVMADARIFLRDENVVVALYMANFGNETQGGELVNSQNVLVKQKHELWRMLSAKPTTADFGGGRVDVEESVLNSAQRDLLVWRWYQVGEVQTANAYRVKWLQLLKRLMGDASPELMMVLYTETLHDDYAQARAVLQRAALTCCRKD